MLVLMMMCSTYSVLGQEVVGIWPKNAANADVNTACVSHAGNAIATGDDYGQVKIFSFPASTKYVSSSKQRYQVPLVI